MDIQQRLLKFVIRSNWVLFLVVSLGGFYFASFDFTKGIVCGGLIVTVNFHLLYRTLKKSLTPPHVASQTEVLIKYYVRFVISGIIIFLLIARHVVDPVGLFVGLSVVVASITAATVCELTKLLFKEAV